MWGRIHSPLKIHSNVKANLFAPLIYLPINYVLFGQRPGSRLIRTKASHFAFSFFSGLPLSAPKKTKAAGSALEGEQIYLRGAFIPAAESNFFPNIESRISKNMTPLKFRDYPGDINKFQFTLNQKLKELEFVTAAIEKANLHSLIGIMFRQLEKLKEAEKHLSEARKIINSNKSIKIYWTNEIRWATLLQYKGEHANAEDIYHLLEKKLIENNDPFDCLHFLYQHRAKNLCETCELEKAMKYFQMALKIRRTKGIIELIHSTESAIEQLHKWIDID